MNRAISVWIVLALWLPIEARAQGVLVVTDAQQSVRLPRPIIIWPPRPWPRPVPVPPATYKIEEIDVQARLVDQVAQVEVSQSFVNTGSRPLEACFLFPLPYDGAVDRLTLLIDGKEYPARLLDANEARRLYEEIVRKNRDPALLEWMGTGLFKTSVFPIPPGQKRTVSLRYSQLLRQRDGLTDFLFPLSTARYTSHPVEKVHLRASIESHEDLKNIYSPSHDVKIDRTDDRHAAVTFEVKNEVPSADFRLFFDVGKGKISARVLSYRPDKDEDGYFLLLATPKIEAAKDSEHPRKTVVFVVDRSGSMSGQKIEQVRAALRFVLNNLRKGDLFNIVAYDSEVEAFRPELQRFDDKTRKAALGFVDGLYAGGSTNIDAALHTALGQLQDSSRPSYVVFLTDGLPTTGVTSEVEIAQHANEANHVRARLFTFGVGYDVNSRLLDKLAREGYGQSEYVRPDENIEAMVSRLYRRIESPVMTDVKIEFTLDRTRDEDARPVNRVYPKGSFDLFAGEQLVVVGRYRRPGAAKVVVRGAVGGKEEKLDFPADLAKKSEGGSYAFVEKLWAVRRVGEILDELDLKGKNDELIKELVELSKRHGILTPYTSFLADETTSLDDADAIRRQADVRLGALSQATGAGGVAQRAFKGALQRAGQAPTASVPALSAPMAANGAAAGGRQSFGFGGGVAAPLAPADREMAQSSQTMRHVGDRVFFRRGGQWIDSTLSESQQKAATRIKQFSQEYFDLARRHGREIAQYLVFDEPTLVNVAGQAFLIDP